MIRRKVNNRLNNLMFVGGDINYTKEGIPILDNCINNIDEKKIIPVIKKVSNQNDCIAHFYIDDFQFERFWNQPQRYIDYLQKYHAVISPDFSTYSNMPYPVLMYNVYRNAILSLIWQRNGVNVIPNVTWAIGQYSNKYIAPFINSNIIVISNIGLNKIEKIKFEKEVIYLMDYHKFQKIIIYGTECKALLQYANIQHVKQYINIRDNG